MNFGPAAKDYARHRIGFPASFFERVKVSGSLLDLGSGTGSLARGFAAHGCDAVALDISREMLSEIAGVPKRVVARAEASPFADESFDAVVAGQCWHWFDGARAAREAFRLVRSGGRVVIANFDYLPIDDNVAVRTEQLLLQHNPAWPFAGVRDWNWSWQLEEVGFASVKRIAYDEAITYSREAWRGRMRACNGVLALRTPERIQAFDSALAAMLEGEPDPFPVPHRITVCEAHK